MRRLYSGEVVWLTFFFKTWPIYSFVVVKVGRVIMSDWFFMLRVQVGGIWCLVDANLVWQTIRSQLTELLPTSTYQSLVLYLKKFE